MKLLLLLTISVSTAAAAQLCMKKSALLTLTSRDALLWLAAAIAAYGIAFLLYALLMRQFHLNRLSPIMSIATTALVVVMATLLFHEPVTPKMLLGLGLGAASILCLLC
ncbi:MAG: hypothetical protein AB7C90_08230 [Bacteroidales bacterium]